MPIGTSIKGCFDLIRDNVYVKVPLIKSTYNYCRFSSNVLKNSSIDSLSAWSPNWFRVFAMICSILSLNNESSSIRFYRVVYINRSKSFWRCRFYENSKDNAPWSDAISFSNTVLAYFNIKRSFWSYLTELRHPST